MALNDTELHTLKTPLTAVIGYAESMRYGDYGDLSADQTEAIDVILKRSREMLAMLEHMREETYVS